MRGHQLFVRFLSQLEGKWNTSGTGSDNLETAKGVGATPLVCAILRHVALAPTESRG